MEDIKKVCRKRASVEESPEDLMVPITPHLKYDHRLALWDPHTPKNDVFDPFAPGPEDKLNLAPYCFKYKSKLSTARKLKFDLCTKFVEVSEDLRVSEEEMIFQSLYSSILEVVISMQFQENRKDSSSCGFQTPRRLGGVDDTCPAAPVKRSKRFRMIHKGKCRKLEF